MSFKKDLAFGATGEQYIINLYPEQLQALDGRNGDMIVLSTGDKVEIKTDKRANSTGNIFLEHYSHHKKQTDGGPFKAQKDGCKYFLYLFFPCKSIFIYETEALVKFLNENENNIRYHIVNSSYSNASGFITPILDIRHLELKLEDIL